MQINAIGFDNLAYGVAVGTSSDPLSTLTSQSPPGSYTLHIPTDALSLFGNNGDRDLSLIDSTTNTLYAAYQISQASGGNWSAGRVTTPEQLPNLGDKDGTIAAGFADMALLIRPGEATDANHPIPHAIAIGGNRLWKARVYPAQAGDAWVYGGSCISGFRCDGLLPYGAVVQLDPAIDLATTGLSLPARRILQAVQTYGAYMMNTTGSNFNIYTAIQSSELDPYGGVYQGSNGEGVQNQIESFLKTATMYVVPPIVKR